jgi:hypothetical protein
MVCRKCIRSCISADNLTAAFYEISRKPGEQAELSLHRSFGEQTASEHSYEREAILTRPGCWLRAMADNFDGETFDQERNGD